MKWSLESRLVSSLKPQEKNPRLLKKSQREQLSKSLAKFGCAEPIVINPDGTIIGGHQRLSILRKEGSKEVDCMVPDKPLDEKEVDELTIRLNKNAGDFDFDLLANAYEPESLLEWGFTMDELHLESIPDQIDTPKTCQLTAKFENEDDLRQAETKIAAIIDLYASAFYKVKVK